MAFRRFGRVTTRRPARKYRRDTDMKMTLTEKIIATHADQDSVKPGDLVEVRVDQTYMDDLGGPVTMDLVEKAGFKKLFDPERVFITVMVNAPNRDIRVAEITKRMRRFAKDFGVSRFYEAGNAGIHNTVVIEEGLALPGELIIGGNSHACMAGAVGAFATGMGSTDIFGILATGQTWLKVPLTMKIEYKGKVDPWVTGKDLILLTIGEIGADGARYRAMEFSGEVINNLSMEERFSMTNMAIEAGAKSGIMACDEKTLEYLKPRAKRAFEPIRGDPEAEYDEVIELDVNGLGPVIALPHLPSNIKPVSEVGDLPIDQVYIGSCTNGWMTDLRMAASILKGHKIASGLRLIIIPSSSEIYRQALKEGLVDIFVDAGAAFSVSTCGPCIGAHMGVLGAGERCLSTSNRNFRGRQGSPESLTYLCNPAVAAASAIVGRVVSPEEVVGRGNLSMYQ
jgi:3-isopropylmalate/(R)-2-methylmalate dehydratase large subunit